MARSGRAGTGCCLAVAILAVAMCMAGQPAAAQTANTQQTAYVMDIVYRLASLESIPFNTSRQLTFIQALNSTIGELGPVTMLQYQEFLPAFMDNYESVPFADVEIKLYINAGANFDTLAAANDTASIDAIVATEYQKAYSAFVGELYTLGYPVSVRQIAMVGSWGTYQPASAVTLRPLERLDLVLSLNGRSAPGFSATNATTILNTLRKTLVGKFASSVIVANYTQGNTAGTVPATLNATILAYACPASTAAVTVPACNADALTAIPATVLGNQFSTLLENTGLNVGVSVKSVKASWVVDPPLTPPAELPDVSVWGTTPWHISRIQARTVPQVDGVPQMGFPDGQNYTASNYGTGVNVYLLSSGVLASHEEFVYPGTNLTTSPGTRVQGLWGINGSNPLQDCSDYASFIGRGTFGASLIGGTHHGVARNVTIHSVRVLRRCTFESYDLFEEDGIFAAMDEVIAKAVAPAVMVIDTWWSPARSPYDNDTFIAAAIKQRLAAAEAANITVVVPAGAASPANPCNNVFAVVGTTITADGTDEYDRRTQAAVVDTTQACVNIWAPGGGIGAVMLGASPQGNAAYLGVVDSSHAAAFLVAGVAAQYLNIRPTAMPSEVRAALAAYSTMGVLTDTGSVSPNALLFTNLTSNSTVVVPAPAAAAAPTVIPASSGSSLSAGAIAGIAVGAALAVALIAVLLFMVCRQRRRDLLPVSRKDLKMDAADKTVNLSGWEVDPKEIRILTRPDGSDWELGEGNFGRVVKGTRDGVQDVAIKMTNRTDLTMQQEFLKEVEMMKFLSRDRNIVQFYGACIQDSRIWLVAEFMEGGDLRTALTADRKSTLSWYNKGKAVALDTARGLHFLHANHVTHRDLKSKNILLTRDMVAKIGDVGMAKVMAEGYLTHDNALGTFAWAAPEMLLGERCTEKVDIYSLGVVLWEIVTQEMPIRGAIRDPHAPEECPTEMVALIRDCMRRNARKRPTAREAYERILACAPHLEVEEELKDVKQLEIIKDMDSAEFIPGTKVLTEEQLADMDSAEGQHLKALDQKAADMAPMFPAPLVGTQRVPRLQKQHSAFEDELSPPTRALADRSPLESPEGSQGVLPPIGDASEEARAEAKVAAAFPGAFNWNDVMAGNSFEAGLNAIAAAAETLPTSEERSGRSAERSPKSRSPKSTGK